MECKLIFAVSPFCKYFSLLGPRWHYKKSLSPPPPMYTLNLHLHTEEFMPRKNGGLSEHLLQNEE